MPLLSPRVSNMDRKTVRISDDVDTRSTTTFTVSSGSDRVVEIRPPRQSASVASGPSVHSPTTSSGGRSFSSGTESWSDLGEEDDLRPSDSASRSRQPSRRHTTEVRPAPTRRHSSRHVVPEREEEEESPPPRPRRRATHTTSSRHRRGESRRTPSDESGSVASYEDYPYSHHGAPQPPRAPYPSGYRHVPAPGPPHGGYPPSVTSAPYMDPFAAQQQAMVHIPHQDPFSPYQQNPFSPQHQQQNPFSPLSSGGTSYFPESTAPSQHGMRPGVAQRPQSFVAPPSHYGPEMAMSPYAYPAHPSMGAYPYPMPGMPGMPPPWAYQNLHSQTGSPAPGPDAAQEKLNAEIEALKAALSGKEAKPETKVVNEEVEALRAALQSKDDAEKSKAAAEMDKLQALVKKYEEAQAAAEKAAAAKKAEEEAEKKKKAEIAEATKKAKEDAEKKADEAMAKAKEEHEKKIAEAKAAQEDAEKKHKELKEEADKTKPTPDSLKAPIKFKDAVGRKFSFPWHICKTWKGMETLIKQAFLHVDVIGDHVHQGHYDLTGPDGEIILPQVWDTMIQPDWEVTMHMWPMPEEEKKEKKKKKHEEEAFVDPLAAWPHLANVNMMGMPAPAATAAAPSGKKDKKSKDGKKKSKSPDIVDLPPNLPPHIAAEMAARSSMAMPGPPNFAAGPGVFPDGIVDPLAGLGLGPGGPIATVVDDKKRSRAKSTKKAPSGLQAWFAGSSGSQRSSKKDDEKLGAVRRRSTGGSSQSHSHSGDQTACLVM
jgi:hypothetical protein